MRIQKKMSANRIDSIMALIVACAGGEQCN